MKLTIAVILAASCVFFGLLCAGLRRLCRVNTGLPHGRQRNSLPSLVARMADVERLPIRVLSLESCLHHRSSAPPPVHLGGDSYTADTGGINIRLFG